VRHGGEIKRRGKRTDQKLVKPNLQRLKTLGPDRVTGEHNTYHRGGGGYRKKITAFTGEKSQQGEFSCLYFPREYLPVGVGQEVGGGGRKRRDIGKRQRTPPPKN